MAQRPWFARPLSPCDSAFRVMRSLVALSGSSTPRLWSLERWRERRLHPGQATCSGTPAIPCAGAGHADGERGGECPETTVLAAPAPPLNQLAAFTAGLVVGRVHCGKLAARRQPRLMLLRAHIESSTLGPATAKELDGGEDREGEQGGRGVRGRWIMMEGGKEEIHGRQTRKTVPR